MTATAGALACLYKERFGLVDIDRVLVGLQQTGAVVTGLRAHGASVLRLRHLLRDQGQGGDAYPHPASGALLPIARDDRVLWDGVAFDGAE